MDGSTKTFNLQLTSFYQIFLITFNGSKREVKTKNPKKFKFDQPSVSQEKIYEFLHSHLHHSN